MGAVYQAAALSKAFKVKPFVVRDAAAFPIQVSCGLLWGAGYNKRCSVSLPQLYLEKSIALLSANRACAFLERGCPAVAAGRSSYQCTQGLGCAPYFSRPCQAAAQPLLAPAAPNQTSCGTLLVTRTGLRSAKQYRVCLLP